MNEDRNVAARRVSGRVAAVVLVATALAAGLIGFGIRALVRDTGGPAPTATPQPQAANATADPPTPTPLAPFPFSTATALPIPGTAPASSPVASVVGGTPGAPTMTPPVEFDAERLYAAVSPAVVTISNKQRINPNAGALREANAGSGLIYDPGGYILTNRHVIDGAEQIDVTLQSGTIVTGTLVGQDPVADIAVVKIDPALAPAVAPLGDSALVRSGQRVVAIGSPLQFETSVTRGIISGTDRSIGGVEGMLQTDAAISPGTSGGPLVNAQGEVIGIATATVRTNQAERIGFAIPINTAKRIAGIIVASGKVTRPYLGVTTELLTPARAEELGVTATRGAYISEVSPNTPAAKAGLQKGDVILSIDRAPVDQMHPLNLVLLDFKPGDTVTVTINRSGTEQPISLTFVERPATLDP
jgi:S1-C subfamily serine protease